jgi:hypothetical protein
MLCLACSSPDENVTKGLDLEALRTKCGFRRARSVCNQALGGPTQYLTLWGVFMDRQNKRCRRSADNLFASHLWPWGREEIIDRQPSLWRHML